EPPRGPWVVCGFGRFGRALVGRLLAEGLPVVAIDPREADAEADPGQGLPVRLCGEGTEAAVLERAGIANAAGLVAGVDKDVSNLAIAALARSLKRGLFVVLRQNDAANQPLF